MINTDELTVQTINIADSSTHSFVECPVHGKDSPVFNITFYLPEGDEKLKTCLRCFRDLVVGSLPSL